LPETSSGKAEMVVPWRGLVGTRIFPSTYLFRRLG
jgi:hypothetical protein